MKCITALTSPPHRPTFSEDCAAQLDEADIQTIEALPPASLAALNKTLAGSLFACKVLVQHPEWLTEYDSALSPPDRNAIKAALDAVLLAAEDEGAFNAGLRAVRQHMMLRIIHADINRDFDLNATTGALSDLAEISLQTAIAFHEPRLQRRFGVPRNRKGEAQPFIIIGMGKLGARELNLSSDIDLIFCYPDGGQTDGDKCIENQEYFIKLGKKVIQSLDAVTADGMVFRVDMRLRPYGQSGALVSPFRALEEYYQTQGREWERYAMVKARVVATSALPSVTPRLNELEAIRLSFTFRKYIDFSVIDALRNLKRLIQQEVRRRQLDDDVKLGSGGIREIEFIAQVFQLIRGGRDTELQQNRVDVILPLLESMNCLPPGVAAKLLEAYTFLRNTEHAIQAFNDEQTQKLPDTPQARDALLAVMSIADWEAFTEKLEQHRAFVRHEFAHVIASPEDDEEEVAEQEEALLLWQQACGIREQDTDSDLASVLNEFAHSPLIQNLTSNSRERLDRFMPLLISEVQHVDDPDSALRRLLPLVHAVARRSAYLVLLMENRDALTQLVKLAATSAQIATQLTTYPALLDELLDTRSLYSLPEKTDLRNELQRAMMRVDEQDLEQQMETLRYFRLSHALRVAACEVAGTLPLMKVSDYLTFLAEVILEYCLTLVWRMMVTRHGYPDGRERETPEFLIVGYGKLGGIEMNHGSDLDLVFIHNASITGYTQGGKEIDNQTFYVCLGQKLIHILNTQTASGRLYEVDMRLRPSGNSGLLATTLSAFEKYQFNDAWTWEHQALVRARPIAGDEGLMETFNALRHRVLGLERDHEALAKDIVEMRYKMRSHLGSDARDDTVFHIKQDAGGIVDIEFMVQYLVLAWSHAEPDIATYTDNIRILEALAHTDKLSAQEVEQLIAAYKALREVTHRLTIEQKPSTISNDALLAERQSVIDIWHRLFPETQTDGADE